MLTASNRLTEREIERLQETAAEGRKTWGYLALWPRARSHSRWRFCSRC